MLGVRSPASPLWPNQAASECCKRHQSHPCTPASGAQPSRSIGCRCKWRALALPWRLALAPPWHGRPCARTTMCMTPRFTLTSCRRQQRDRRRCSTRASLAQVKVVIESGPAIAGKSRTSAIRIRASGGASATSGRPTARARSTRQVGGGGRVCRDACSRRISVASRAQKEDTWIRKPHCTRGSHASHVRTANTLTQMAPIRAKRAGRANMLRDLPASRQKRARSASEVPFSGRLPSPANLATQVSSRTPSTSRNAIAAAQENSRTRPAKTPANRAGLGWTVRKRSGASVLPAA